VGAHEFPQDRGFADIRLAHDQQRRHADAARAPEELGQPVQGGLALGIVNPAVGQDLRDPRLVVDVDLDLALTHHGSISPVVALTVW